MKNILIVLVVMLVAFFAVKTLNSKDKKANEVIKKKVSFESQNQTVIGDLYLPGDYKKGDKLPGVIVSGSWTSIKEQMSGGYAKELAQRGYAALAFDFRGWGESAKDAPISLKYVENPAEKIKDIIAAAEYLSSLEEIDKSKLSTLGVCASAGYAIDAVHQSDLIKSAAVVAPWLHDAEIVKQVYGERIPSLMKASQIAEETGEPDYLEAASDTNENSVMYKAAYYTDSSRGAIPEYDNKFSTLSWKPWLTYDAIKTASKIKAPVLLVHSEKAAIPQGAKKFVSQASDNVQLVMIEDTTQFDFYDNPESVNIALDKVDKHYKKVFKN